MRSYCGMGVNFLVMLSLFTSIQAHGILTTPAPRTGQDVSPGVKLTAFAAAKTVADTSCGGAANNDPGVQIPTVAFVPGATTTVGWQLTIPHPADVLDTGIRVAIHYSATDSFAQNIVAGGLVGDVGTTPLSAGPANAAANSIQSTTITIPAGKTCNYCTIQWVWAARKCSAMEPEAPPTPSSLGTLSHGGRSLTAQVPTAATTSAAPTSPSPLTAHSLILRTCHRRPALSQTKHPVVAAGGVAAAPSASTHPCPPTRPARRLCRRIRSLRR